MGNTKKKPTKPTTNVSTVEKSTTPKRLPIKHLCIFSTLLSLLAIIFTILVATVDVAPALSDSNIPPVGFSALNSDIRIGLGLYGDIDKTWYIISNYAGYILLAIPLFYVGLGIYQLITRRDPKKVDQSLLALAGFYLAMIAVYVIFEKLLIINYRPVLLGEGPEPSYPSSHTLFSLCICGSAAIINQKLFSQYKYTKFINLALILLAILIIVGRFLSGVHWLTDIAGGVIISSALLAIFYLVLSFLPKPKANKTQ